MSQCGYFPYPMQYYYKKINKFNPFSPGDFAKKPVLKLVKRFSGHCCAIKRRFTTKPITSCTLRGLLIQMQNISLQSSGMHRKQNFTAVLTFAVLFLSSPLFCFSCLTFKGNVFRKAFRILGLDERKGRWVLEQDFHGNFQVHIT